MNAKEARTVLRGHRAGQQQDARLQKALRHAEQDNALKREFQQQTEFDDRMINLVESLPLPEGLLDRMKSLEAEPARRRLDWRAALKQPPVLAGLIGLVVMVGILIYFWMDRMQNFPGREALFRMLSTTQEMSGVELDPLITEAGKVGDWFLLKYGLEDFNVPPEFAAMKTVGSRIFKQDNFPVAQIAVERDRDLGPFPESGLLFFIFRADDFGVKLPSNRWYVFTQEDWVAAVRAEDKTCFMVAVRGTREQMDEFLKQLPKQTPPKQD